MVEKIKRDVRITTIYEGTSEIMEMTISRDRWQQHLKTRGQYYRDEARRLQELGSKHPGIGAGVAALASLALAEVLEKSRIERLTRYQHILLRLGELIAYAECAGSLCRRAAMAAERRLNDKSHPRFDADALAALARIFAREAAMKVAADSMRWITGAAAMTNGDTTAFEGSLAFAAIHRAQAGLVADMDHVADVIYGRAARHAGSSS
jgi:alkylation response protein AidB-like acyl-CoA dehydrogenase